MELKKVKNKKIKKQTVMGDIRRQKNENGRKNDNRKLDKN